jgi:hypothetical protein
MTAQDPPDLPEPTGPPPFSYQEDDDFLSDMTQLAPDERIRDEICESIQFTINRILAGLDVPGHVSLSEGIESQLLVTEGTGVAPALRVVFSVVDEYPKRHIFLHAAGLQE